MTDEIRNALRKLGWLDLIISLWINFAGATLTFIYFNFIESGLRTIPVNLSARARIILFFIIASVLLTAVTITALRACRSRRALWEIDKEQSDPEKLESLRVCLMNMPFRTAVRSAVGWMAVGAPKFRIETEHAGIVPSSGGLRVAEGRDLRWAC